MRGVSITGALALIAAGAILRYAITAHVTGVNIQTIGLILLVVGIIALIISLLWMAIVVNNQRQARPGGRAAPRDGDYY